MAQVSDLTANFGPLSVPDNSHAEEAFPDLPAEMLEGVASAETMEAALQSLTASVVRRVEVVAIGFFGRAESDGPLGDSPDVLAGQMDAAEELSASDISRRSCELGQMQVAPAGGEDRFLVAVPVVARDRLPEAVCALVQGEARATRTGDVLQLAAAHVTLWRTLQSVVSAEREADNVSALLEILAKTEASGTLRTASLTLVNELQDFLHCQLVAVAVGSGGQCRLQAVSGYAKFDRHAAFAQAIQAALDETLLMNRVVSWPPSAEDGGREVRSFKQVCDTLGADYVVGSPLTDEAGQPIGAWLFVNPGDNKSRPQIDHLAAATQQQVGTSLRLVQRSQRGPLVRAVRSFFLTKSWSKPAALVAAAVLLAGLLAWPGDYKIGCDCVVQPVVRRFVAAPYEGTLETTLVAPGDIVGEQQVLAQMDGREIRLELQGLEAEHTRARMDWKTALSDSDISLAQREHMEMKRLDLKMKLLRQRQDTLQIRSPLSGIVVSGDLEKSEGAPLKVGQSLFEIAPLDRMTVEVEIPEEDIAHVRPGMEVLIHLDAFAADPQKAVIQRIVPRAEAREAAMVFVATTELDNSAGLLRPGMNGRAKIVGPRHSLAWRLFHKPCESLMMILGW